MDVVMPDGTTIQGIPDGTSKADIAQKYASHLGSAAPSTAQPTATDQALASPLTRMATGIVKPLIIGMPSLLNSVASPLSALANLFPNSGPAKAYQAAMKAPSQAFDKPFNDAQAAVRNTPGYATARAQADAANAQFPSGMTDQLSPVSAPVVAGITGGGLYGDRANAYADSKQASMADYAKLHPLLATTANLLGGLGSMGPSGGAASLPTASDAATSYVANLMKKNAVTPADLAAANPAAVSKGMTAAEAIGPNGVNHLAALGNRSGTTPNALSGTIEARMQGAPQRILGDYAQASGINPAAAQGQFDDVLAAGQKKATPLYTQAYAANQNIASPTLDRILATPAGRSAMNDARTMMQNDRSLMGVSDPDLVEQAAEGGTDVPWNGGVASGLKLRTYDYIKRALDDQIGTQFRAGNKTQGGILVGLKNDLLKELDNADVTGIAGPNSLKPEGGMYAQARKAASDNFKVQDAFTDGQNDILSTVVTPAQVTTKLQSMSAPEIEAYKGGIANKLFAQAQNLRLAPKFINVPAVQQKLSAALGPTQAQAFIDNVTAEAGLSKTGSRMLPLTNSKTAEIAQATADQDATGTMQNAFDLAHAGAHALSGNAYGAINNIGKVLQRTGAVSRTLGMPEGVRNEAGNLLLMSPPDLANILKITSAQTAKKPSLLPSAAMAAIQLQNPQ